MSLGENSSLIRIAPPTPGTDLLSNLHLISDTRSPLDKLTLRRHGPHRQSPRRLEPVYWWVRHHGLSLRIAQWPQPQGRLIGSQSDSFHAACLRCEGVKHSGKPTLRTFSPCCVHPSTKPSSAPSSTWLLRSMMSRTRIYWSISLPQIDSYGKGSRKVAES